MGIIARNLLYGVLPLPLQNVKGYAVGASISAACLQLRRALLLRRIIARPIEIQPCVAQTDGAHPLTGMNVLLCYSSGQFF